MNDPRIALLQQMPVFGGLRPQVLMYLLELSRIVARPSGDYFFQEGERGEAMYVLEQGSVEVLKQADGEACMLRRLRAGDCFGEMALIDMSPRSASVRAIEDCSAIEILPASLLRIYEQEPEQFTLIQMNLARELSRRLREADERLFSRAGAPETVLKNGDKSIS